MTIDYPDLWNMVFWVTRVWATVTHIWLQNKLIPFDVRVIFEGRELLEKAKLVISKTNL